MSTLSIVLAARSRPELLVHTLARTLPIIHDPSTRILVALDDDDPETIQAAQKFAWSHRRVRLSIRPREDSLGEKFNRVLTEAPADVYLAMVDYAPHITPGFDRLILDAASLFPDKIGVVFNAQSVESSALSAINAVTHRLAELMGGFYPGLYPYWFVDHHLNDIAQMIGRIAYADVELDVSRRPGTMDLREPIWWATFCDHLMPQRQAVARKIIAEMDEPAWRKDMLLGAFPHHAYVSWFINECMRTHPWDFIRHETNTADARYQRIKRRAIEAVPQMHQRGLDKTGRSSVLKARSPLRKEISLMTEKDFKAQLQSAQDMIDGLINQRNNAFNENVQLHAQIKAAQRRIQELEASGAAPAAKDGDIIVPKANGQVEVHAAAAA